MSAARPEVRILDEATLRQRVNLDDEVIDAIEGAFAALAGGDVVMPPVLRLDLPPHRGEVDVKTAWIPALPSFAIKVSPGFFDNPKLGLPSLNGLVILLSARTGLLEALLLDNGYLTDLRTAAAGAVAARWLAPELVILIQAMKPRSVAPAGDKVVVFPILGGLHHDYRLTA